MKKNTKRVILCLVIGGLVVVGMLFSKFQSYKKKVKSTTVEHIDFAKVADGTYSGFFDLILVKAKVTVSTAQGKVTAIDIVEHKNGRGEKAETIVFKVIEKQTLQVDAISGATASSKAILKAVENAIQKGLPTD